MKSQTNGKAYGYMNNKFYEMNYDENVIHAVDLKVEEEDIVNNPNHYADTKYECREVSGEIFKDLKGIEAIDSFNVFKYIWRWHKKNGLQDLEKCKNYLEHLINHVSNK